MAVRMPAARESCDYYQTITLGKELASGAIDITGWTFKLQLARDNVASPLMTLGMAAAYTDQGFQIIDGPNRVISIRISAANLVALPDTTGDFEMFGDLLATPPGSARFPVADLILPISKGPTT